MVGEPLSEGPAINGLYWSYQPSGNVDHIAEHGVRPDDVQQVLGLAPRFFGDRKDPEAVIAVGPAPDGRYLAIVLSPTFVPREWVVETAYWLGSRGKALYERWHADEG